MRAWVRQSKESQGGWADIDEAALPDRPLLLDVSHSALNYKDALAISGRSPIFRSFPMIPGIDVVGTVISDETGTFAAGSRIIATGSGMGETSMGGFAQRVRLDPDWAVAVPQDMPAANAAAVGTAGVTAALSVLALQDFGIKPETGPVLVTGATGGVGGFSVSLLAALGHEVIAVTGRLAESDYLKSLGASQIVDRATLEGEPRPLGKELWPAAVDVAGGKILANVLSNLCYGGVVAASGLAQSLSLPTSVAPFILRGVSLLGIDSVYASKPRRERAWALMGDNLNPDHIEAMKSLHDFAEVDRLAPQLLDQQLRGRAVFEWR